MNDTLFTSLNGKWVGRPIVRSETSHDTADMRRDSGDLPAGRGRPSQHAEEPQGDLGTEVALLALADAAAASLAEGRSDLRGPADLVARIAEESGVAPAAVALALLTRIVMSPQLLQLPPDRAIALQLGTLASLAELRRVSLWSFGRGAVACRFSSGEDGDGADEHAVAEALLGLRSPLPSGARGDLVAATALRAGAPAAVVVGRPSPASTAEVEPFLEVACLALGLVLEREALLQRETPLERDTPADASLVEAYERRLTRLGLDLHDGPLQEIAVMAADLHTARSRAGEMLPSPGREQMIGVLDGLLERLNELDGGLREVARSLETAEVVRAPLADVLRTEIAMFERRSGVDATLRVRGEIDALTESQKIALLRIVQASLSNVHQHSGASSVSVNVAATESSTRLEITDDGRGFDVDEALAESTRRGRLGMLGASKRTRLLGGKFAVISSPSAGTRVVVSLPRRIA